MAVFLIAWCVYAAYAFPTPHFRKEERVIWVAYAICGILASSEMFHPKFNTAIQILNIGLCLTAVLAQFTPGKQNCANRGSSEPEWMFVVPPPESSRELVQDLVVTGHASIRRGRELDLVACRPHCAQEVKTAVRTAITMIFDFISRIPLPNLPRGARRHDPAACMVTFPDSQARRILS
jgi:hypothetical protein